MTRMPRQKPGRSKQDYATPRELLTEARLLLNIEDFHYDLAASAENAVCANFYTEAQDSLVQHWWTPTGAWNWLNPPFNDCSPWTQKAWESTQTNARTAMLVPAAVGANWWREWVHRKADVVFLNGRLSFDGKAPYPKDCALLLYERRCGDVLGTGRRTYDVWDWRHWREET